LRLQEQALALLTHNQGWDAKLSTGDVLSSHAEASDALTEPSAIEQAGIETPLQKVLQRALSWLASRGKNFSGHIAKRHIAKILGKSTYVDGGKFVKKWVTKTIEKPDNVIDQGRRLLVEKAFEHDVGSQGERIVRVVIDKTTGKLVTSFPAATYRALLSPVALGVATQTAEHADATIETHRRAVEEAQKPGFWGTLAEWLVGPSSTARDEDILAEQRIIDDAVRGAIERAEQQQQCSLSQPERKAVREAVLVEMNLEPRAGDVT